MTTNQDTEATHICHACIDDKLLSEEVKKEWPPTMCSYCGKTREAIALEDLADRIHDVLHEHFQLTPNFPDEPHEHFLSMHGRWERRGESPSSVIAEMAGLDEEPANDVTLLLSEQYSYRAVKDGGEDPYGLEAMYEEREPFDLGFRLTWAEFRREIRSRSRFFNADSEQMLDDIFGDLATHRTYEGQPVIREINPNGRDRLVWRARTAASSEVASVILRNPAQELGPPPSESAKAGRMNAHGIPVFYGALEKRTCVSELRPPVGSGVVIGQFEILRTVRLLDLEALAKLYTNSSYFDPDYAMHKGRTSFLKHLVWEISQPVLPEVEALEYIATQVVAEYLAQKVTPPLDGIIYLSAQSNEVGKNIVLFNHASRVEPYDLPKDSSVEVLPHDDLLSDPEGDLYDGILVIETVPSNSVETPANKRDGMPASVRMGYIERELLIENQDDREITLRFVPESIRVLRISGVNYATSTKHVNRRRQTIEERDALERRFGAYVSSDE